MEVHKQYNLRSSKTLGTPTKKSAKTPAKKNIEILARENLKVPIQRRPETVVKSTQTNDPSTSQQR